MGGLTMGLTLGLTSGLIGQTVRQPHPLVTLLGASLLALWDAARTDLITESSGAVSSWRDVVAGYDVTATGSIRPIWSATSFSGKPGITFDGANDCLTMASQPFPDAALPSEIWALVSQDALVADATTRAAVSYGGNSGNTSRQTSRTVASGVNRIRSSVGTGAASTAVNGTLVDLSGQKIMRTSFGATTLSHQVDATADGSIAGVPVTGTTRFRIGANTSDAAGGFWNGKVVVVMVTPALTGPQATAVAAYLEGRK